MLREELCIWLSCSWQNLLKRCYLWFNIFCSSKNFFQDFWQGFDANTCPCQKQWVILTRHQAVKSNTVPSIQRPHLYTHYHNFSFRESFAWLRNTAPLWNCWQPFQFPKEKWDFFFDGINRHVTDKTRQLAVLRNIISFVEETSVAALRTAMKYQEKCQQLCNHIIWMPHCFGYLPLLQAAPYWTIPRACDLMQTPLDARTFFPFPVLLAF